MIVDNLYGTQFDYGQLGVKLDKAFNWLRANDLLSFKPGRVPIDGERVFAEVQEYMTFDPAGAYFERHRSYIDIQMLVKGNEIIHWASADKLTTVRTPYNFEKDIVFYEEPAASLPVTLNDGDFAVFFPSDGHKPRGWVSVASPIRKIVVKVST
jgi:YhcH/YjgK/YiaL family protein